ncbi:MAG: biotin/lipoyl-containing protein, partial [Telluria sp.]
MADMKEVLVPDIGDFSDVPVIEVLVGAGDTVAAEDPLVTLESDKATMDVPAPFAGQVAELKVNVGDTVSVGSLLLTLQVEAEGAPPSGDGAPATAPLATGPGQVGAVETAEQAEAGAVEPAEASADGDGHQAPPASP